MKHSIKLLYLILTTLTSWISIKADKRKGGKVMIEKAYPIAFEIAGPSAMFARPERPPCVKGAGARAPEGL